LCIVSQSRSQQLKQFISHAQTIPAKDINVSALISLEQSVIETIETIHNAADQGDLDSALGTLCNRDPYALYLEYAIREGSLLNHDELQREIAAIAQTRPTEAAHLQTILDYQPKNRWGSNA